MKFSFILCDPVPELAELSVRMNRVAALGYQGIELVATHPLGFPVEALASAAERAGLPVVSLLSGWSYANEGLCLASPDEVIRDRAVARLVDYVKLAARLGSLVVVGLMQGLRQDEPDPAKANERIAAALARVARVAEDVRVPIVIEPVNHLQVGFNHTAAEVAELVDRIGSSAVGLMLDTLHMNIEERSVVDTIRRYGAQIGHFHLCESNGGPFGSGNVDFPAVLGALAEVGYDQFVSVKIYRHAGWEEAGCSAMEFLRAICPREAPRSTTVSNRS
ncbi:MAG: sugar phosphate isomerase/epimerase [Planctomycetia bacterium]|nr:sugar phosphate isomerase/epimerase [Planctomycetia bacterium]